VGGPALRAGGDAAHTAACHFAFAGARARPAEPEDDLGMPGPPAAPSKPSTPATPAIPPAAGQGQE